MSWIGFAFWALFVAVGLLGIFAQIAARMIWKLQREMARLESHQITSYAEYKALMRRQFPSSKRPKS